MKIVLLDESVGEAVAANDGYCPCAVFRTEDTKCICKAFLEQEELGPCLCGRYEKVEL